MSAALVKLSGMPLTRKWAGTFPYQRPKRLPDRHRHFLASKTFSGLDGHERVYEKAIKDLDPGGR